VRSESLTARDSDLGMELRGIVEERGRDAGTPTALRPRMSNNHLFETVDSTLLSSVTGAGDNVDEAEVKLKVDLGEASGEGRIGITTKDTDYKTCLRELSKLPGATAETIGKACGLPPA